MAEHELDGIFDGQDVTAFSHVPMIQHRCERSRLAHAGSANNKHQTFLAHDHGFIDFWQTKLIECWDIRLYIADDHGDFAALHIYIDAEPTQIDIRNTQV